MRRTISAKITKTPQKTTKDGRILGDPVEDYVPKQFRNVIPEPKDKNKNVRSKERKAKSKLAHMTRTLMPLALQEDGEVNNKGYAFRMKGINQARFNALIAAYRTGMTTRGACQYSGICYETLHSWMQKGEEGKQPYVHIMLAVKEAQACLEKQLIESIIAAGTQVYQYEETTVEDVPIGSGEDQVLITKKKVVTKTQLPKWQASAWWLERRMRQDYALTPPAESREAYENAGEDDLEAMLVLTVGVVNKPDE